MPIAARNGHSTAPFAPECQSFLDNLRAGFGFNGSANDPPTNRPVFIAKAIHCNQHRPSDRGWAPQRHSATANLVRLVLHTAAFWLTHAREIVRYFLGADVTGSRVPVASSFSDGGVLDRDPSGDTNSTVIDLFSGLSSNWPCCSARANTVAVAFWSPLSAFSERLRTIPSIFEISQTLSPSRTETFSPKILWGPRKIATSADLCESE
jgi:hypothetical protein